MTAIIITYLLQLLGAVVMALISYLATRFTQKLNLEIEARHRAALHSAIVSGIASALAMGLKDEEAKRAALEYVTVSVPDALRALAPSPEVLAALITSKLK